MAQKFLTNIDLNQNQIIKGQFESVASDPTTGNFEGRLIYNSTEKVIKVFDGTGWRKALHAVNSNTTALTSSESNGTITLTIADAVAGTTSGLLSGADKQKLDNAATAATPNTLALRDASGRLQVAAPSSDNDAANKGYVDAARSGLDVKESVRAATVSDVTLSGTQTIDDVVLVEGDRVLVKNQDTSSENGIYIVDEDSWSRSTDADTSTEVNAGMFTFVEEGTVNADSGWVLTTNNPITLGTTPLSFAQFSGAGQVIAGDGLTKTGNQLDVGGTTDRITITADAVDIASTYVGQSSITTLGTVGTGTWQGSTVAIEYGGTGATSASVARTNLADTPTAGQTTGTATLARVVSQTIGDNSATSFTVTHNFGTRDVIVQVYDLATYETVITDVVRTNANSVTVTFSVAPDTGTYKVVVTG